MADGPRRRIGIDLGGTKIEGVVLDEAGRSVVRHRIATESSRGYEHIVARVAAVAAQLLREAPTSTVIGVGTPGAVSRRDHTMKNCNTTCLNGRHLQQDLETALAMPVRIENDANCFALAEAVAGAGQAAGLVFGVIMGTGVGGGIVCNGAVRQGPHHIAGEWGHHCIDTTGPECYCGQRGCVERYLSGPAVEAHYAAVTGRARSLAEVVAEFRAGEAAAHLVLGQFLDRFGRALANVIDILDPDVVVLGGGVSNIDELYTLGREAVVRYVFNDELRTPIRRHHLGDSAGVIGAALLT